TSSTLFPYTTLFRSLLRLDFFPLAQSLHMLFEQCLIKLLFALESNLFQDVFLPTNFSFYPPFHTRNVYLKLKITTRFEYCQGCFVSFCVRHMNYTFCVL